jgi:hypothetical protein
LDDVWEMEDLIVEGFVGWFVVEGFFTGHLFVGFLVFYVFDGG